VEKTLFDKTGTAVGYVTDDYNRSIYLWDGSPVAYVYNEEHIYGINGRHLGWFINEILYDGAGDRIGFTNNTCPVSVAKEPMKSKRQPMDEIRPRWAAPPLPNLSFNYATQELSDFLEEGQVVRFQAEPSAEESQD
jgi:hypothetical protein